MSAAAVITRYGCTCVSSCGRTLNLGGVKWCYTSIFHPSPTPILCGRYSERHAAYWDECDLVTNSTQTGLHYVSDFRTLWGYLTLAAGAGCAAAFALVGLFAALRAGPARSRVLWLPVLTGVAGGLQGALVGAVFAAALAFLYLSLPYALPLEFVLALGLALAVLITYASLGRSYRQMDAPHPAEYAD